MSEANDKKTPSEAGGRGRKYSASGTRPKTYSLPFYAYQAFRNLAKEYGSQGRAIQVGIELLFRIGRKLSVAPAADPLTSIRWTYKLPPRTIDLVQRLATDRYKNEGEVLAACVKILEMDKIPVPNPRQRRTASVQNRLPAQDGQNPADTKEAGGADQTPQA